MIKIDFHTHSTSSDGLMSPKEVVERAYQNGVKYLKIFYFLYIQQERDEV